MLTLVMQKNVNYKNYERMLITSRLLTAIFFASLPKFLMSIRMLQQNSRYPNYITQMIRKYTKVNLFVAYKK